MADSGRMTKGSFATGYEHITRLAYICPAHGEVGMNVVLPTADGGNYHVGCGLDTERRRVPNSPTPPQWTCPTHGPVPVGQVAMGADGAWRHRICGLVEASCGQVVTRHDA